jgi:hypothetical protein
LIFRRNGSHHHRLTNDPEVELTEKFFTVRVSDGGDGGQDAYKLLESYVYSAKQYIPTWVQTKSRPRAKKNTTLFSLSVLVIWTNARTRERVDIHICASLSLARVCPKLTKEKQRMRNAHYQKMG